MQTPQNIYTIINVSNISYSKNIEDTLIGIYKITSPSGKIYIGQSNNIYNRFYTYKKLNCKKQIYLYSSLLKYGVENHKFEIVKLCSIDELNFFEVYYSDLYKSTNRDFGLNLRDCGGCNSFHSNESRKKMSLSSLGKIKSEESKNKMSLAKKGKLPYIAGKKHSIFSKSKSSASNLGKQLTQKQLDTNRKNLRKKSVIEKVRQSNIGRNHTEDAKIKMRKPKTEEHKKNISIGLTGKKFPLDRVKRMSEIRMGQKAWNKGLKASDEAKENMRLARLGKKAWNKGVPMTEDAKKKSVETKRVNRQERLTMIF